MNITMRIKAVVIELRRQMKMSQKKTQLTELLTHTIRVKIAFYRVQGRKFYDTHL